MGSGLTYGYSQRSLPILINPLIDPGLPSLPLMQSAGGLTESGPFPVAGSAKAQPSVSRANAHMSSLTPVSSPNLGPHPVAPIEALADYADTHTIDEVWIALPLEHGADLHQALDALHTSPANLRYVPDVGDLYLLNHGVSRLLDTPVIDLSASPFQGQAIEDKVLASVLLILAAPAMLLIAIGVKLSSPGSILFRQRRNGWGGRVIEVWKFRSMRAHREAPGQLTQAHPEDPRVTRFGAFLRRTSLDELPQLFNVLQGGMSLVGPRPHAVEHNRAYKPLIERYMLRHKVKPGLTGWAQV